MDSERYGRIAKRMPCAVRVDERRYSGLVLNVSRGGLFIQTNADAGRGRPVGLELQVPEEDSGIALSGTVAWRKVVPGQLASVDAGGFGIRIEQADERYYNALARWMRIELRRSEDAARAPEEPDPGAGAQPTWRVRVRAVATPRSRSLAVEAASADEARESALGLVGDGWQVIEVDAL